MDWQPIETAPKNGTPVDAASCSTGEVMIRRKLKVWGGSWDGRNRAIVAAPTKKRAVELLALVGHYMSRNYFDGYWCETGNDGELAIGSEEGVWVREGMWDTPYMRVSEKL